MTKLPVATYRELSKIAESAGFQWIRRQGSHSIFRNAQGQTTVIPDHESQDIARPLLRKILRDVGLSVDEYIALLDEI